MKLKEMNPAKQVIKFNFAELLIDWKSLWK